MSNDMLNALFPIGTSDAHPSGMFCCFCCDFMKGAGWYTPKNLFLVGTLLVRLLFCHGDMIIQLINVISANCQPKVNIEPSYRNRSTGLIVAWVECLWQYAWFFYRSPLKYLVLVGRYHVCTVHINLTSCAVFPGDVLSILTSQQTNPSKFGVNANL